MKIALTAHDNKRELIVQFCIAYRRILGEHSLCATRLTCHSIAEATGLELQELLLEAQGGNEQITTAIKFEEIDMVLFFRDPYSEQINSQADMDLIKECDIQKVPIATNIATAEMLIQGLERGDLDWRELVRKK